MSVSKECCLQRVEAFALVVQERTGAKRAAQVQSRTVNTDSSRRDQDQDTVGTVFHLYVGTLETSGTSWRFDPNQPQYVNEAKTITQNSNLSSKTFIP